MVQEAGLDSILKWTFNQNVTDDFEILLLSRKNPIVLLRRSDGIVHCNKNSEFRDLVQLISEGGYDVAVKLTSVSIENNGVFAISIPRHKFFNSNASLIVKGA